MTREQSLTKRRELVESGYTIVPGVMDKDLLDRLKTWSDRIFELGYNRERPHGIRHTYRRRRCIRRASIDLERKIGATPHPHTVTGRSGTLRYQPRP